MADTKNGRDKQARDEENRQRRREVLEELERGAETEPPVDDEDLDDLEGDLDALDYPVAASEVVDEVGDREVEAADRTYTVAELLPDTDAETYEEPADVRARVQRPTVAAGMKRIVEASQTLPKAGVWGSQREAFEKTLRELEDIDAVDDDEGIDAITDWIVERIREKEKLPGSRAVRRQAAKIARQSGYEVRNDEWLGV